MVQSMNQRLLTVENTLSRLYNLEGLRDTQNTKKMDQIVESVVARYKSTVDFPISTQEDLDTLNDRCVTEKFSNELVSN